MKQARHRDAILRMDPEVLILLSAVAGILGRPGIPKWEIMYLGGRWARQYQVCAISADAVVSKRKVRWCPAFCVFVHFRDSLKSFFLSMANIGEGERVDWIRMSNFNLIGLPNYIFVFHFGGHEILKTFKWKHSVPLCQVLLCTRWHISHKCKCGLIKYSPEQSICLNDCLILHFPQSLTLCVLAAGG